MNKFVKPIGLGALGLMLMHSACGLPAASANPATGPVNVDIVNSKGQAVGKAVLTQQDNGVRIHIEASKLPPGVHGIHFHETGKCGTPDFKNAGAHFNPGKKQHGFHNPKGFHAGDLPNITVKDDGTVVADLVSNQVSLVKGQPNSLIKKGGSALVIHEQADDYKTDPAGNSGNRIACGVIK